MKGYGKIGALMGNFPESAIVKRFSDLHVQNILYLQAEIAGLELDFRRCEAENENSRDGEKQQFSLDWYTLSTTKDEREDTEQWQLALLIRKKLKEYGDTHLLLSDAVADIYEMQTRLFSDTANSFR
jgi:hypothetical protein